MAECEVKINGCSIFFESMDDLQTPARIHDGREPNKKIFEWDNETIKGAAQPLVDTLSGIYQTVQTLAPDELELSMKLELAAKGEVPVFRVLSVGSKCEIAAKFVWKKS